MSAARHLRWLRALCFSALGLNRRARARLDGTQAAVLNYHRVIPNEQAQRERVEEGMHVTPETFACHLDWLQEYFRVLPLHEIIARIESGHDLPPGACAITFDDGWRDNYVNAHPELERRGLPATIFVVSERVGTLGPFWPDVVSRRISQLDDASRRSLVRKLGAKRDGDPVHNIIVHLKGLARDEFDGALAALREETPGGDAPKPELLDWTELDALSCAGIDIESHGATHAILPTLAVSDVEWELRTSLERLRERGHARHRLLAYPVGEQGIRERQLAGELGYRAAFTILRGLVSADQERLALPRLMIHEVMSRTRPEFLLKVPGWD